MHPSVACHGGVYVHPSLACQHVMEVCNMHPSVACHGGV